MKRKILLTILASLTLISACTNNPRSTQNTAPDFPVAEEQVPQNPIKSQEAAKPAECSPLAEKQYLEPLEEYSWEREYPPEYVMLHFTSNIVADPANPYNLDSVRKIFQSSGISIHYIIDRGGNIYCWIPETRAAWHAGVGTFADDERFTNKMNKYAIGIEMLAAGSQKDMEQYLTKEEYDAVDPSLYGFTDSQYAALRELVADICGRNEIPFDKAHVIGHSEYNPAKSDPGELFAWDELFSNG